MFCPKCGNELRDGDAFCGKCGAKIGGAAPAGAAAQEVPSADAARTSAPEPEKPKKGRKPLAVLAAAVVLLLAAGGAYIAIAGPFGPKDETPATQPSGSADPEPDKDGKDEGDADDEADEGKKDGKKKAGELTDGTVTVSNVKIEKVDFESLPGALRSGGSTSDDGNPFSEILNGSYGPQGEEIYAITMDAENATTSSVKGWLKMDCSVTMTDDYGDEKTDERSFETYRWSGTAGYGDLQESDAGAFFLAPKEKREVTIFAAWRGSKPAGSSQDPNSAPPSSWVERQMGIGGRDGAVVSDVEPTGVGSAALGSPHGLIAVTDENVSVEGGAARAFQNEMAGISRDCVGADVTVKNATKHKAEKLTVTCWVRYDGVLVPVSIKLAAEHIKPGEEVKLTPEENAVSYLMNYEGDPSELEVVPQFIDYVRD